MFSKVFGWEKAAKYLVPMKQYKLVYNPADSDERYIFSNIGVDQFNEPVSIQREEAAMPSEQEFGKKKSEIIDFEDEEYVALKEREQQPYIVSDADSRIYSGKMQNIADSSSMYFALINMGNYLKLAPIAKWYGFVQKSNFGDGCVEALEKNLSMVEFANEEEDTSDPEIDYEAEFDDDDGEDQLVEIVREKSLTSSGRELKGLVDNYEKEDTAKAVVHENTDHPDDAERVKRVRTEAILSKAEIRNIFGKGKISVKDLLKTIKSKYKLEEPEKLMIREFIHESCVFETDPLTGEKMFKLKQI